MPIHNYILYIFYYTWICHPTYSTAIIEQQDVVVHMTNVCTVEPNPDPGGANIIERVSLITSIDVVTFNNPTFSKRLHVRLACMDSFTIALFLWVPFLAQVKLNTPESCFH